MLTWLSKSTRLQTWWVWVQDKRCRTDPQTASEALGGQMLRSFHCQFWHSPCSHDLITKDGTSRQDLWQPGNVKARRPHKHQAVLHRSVKEQHSSMILFYNQFCVPFVWTYHLKSLVCSFPEQELVCWYPFVYIVVSASPINLKRKNPPFRRPQYVYC